MKISILSFLLFPMLLASCSGAVPAPRRTVLIAHAGRLAYVEDVTHDSFSIPELGIKAEGKYISLGDYVATSSGTKYDILGDGTTRIGRLALKKQPLQKSAAQQVNINEIDNKTYIVNPNDDAVRFYHYDNAINQGEMFILVPPRSKPLDIYLDDVRLFTQKRMPVFISFSEEDITFHVSGDSALFSGTVNPTKDEVSSYETLKSYAEDIMENHIMDLGILGIHAALTKVCAIETGFGVAVVPAASPLLSYLLGGAMMAYSAHVLITKGLEGYMTETSNLIGQISMSLVDLVDKTLELFYGSDGRDGMNGASAMQLSGNVSFTGNGHLCIEGGSGEKGGDAKTGIDFAYDGGNGGNGGNGIECTTIISDIPAFDLVIYGGGAGQGGKGSWHWGDSGYTGRDGTSGAGIVATHKFIQ